MSYADHDLTIYRDENGEPIATDVTKTVNAHRKALERMADQMTTLYALAPGPERRALMVMAGQYGVFRTRLNTIEG